MAFGEHAAWLCAQMPWTADGAAWIHDVADERAPQVLVCLDAFHVVR